MCSVVRKNTRRIGSLERIHLITAHSYAAPLRPPTPPPWGLAPAPPPPPPPPPPLSLDDLVALFDLASGLANNPAASTTVRHNRSLAISWGHKTRADKGKQGGNACKDIGMQSLTIFDHSRNNPRRFPNLGKARGVIFADMFRHTKSQTHKWRSLPVLLPLHRRRSRRCQGRPNIRARRLLRRRPSFCGPDKYFRMCALRLLGVGRRRWPRIKVRQPTT